MSQRLLILNWHNVDRSWCFPAPPGAASEGFAAQLRWLDRWATVVELEQAVSDLRSRRPLPPRAVALTFDDGYRDNLTTAVPLLRQLGLPATFFLVPGILDGTIDPWWERLGWAFAHCAGDALGIAGRSERDRHAAYQWACDELKRLDEKTRRQAIDELLDRLGVTPPPRPVPFLDWDDAIQVVRGGFDVGSHAQDHAILARETPAAQIRNLVTARHQLQQRLGTPVRGLAYPNGTHEDFGPSTLAAARQAGHAYAVTTQDGWNRPQTPRLELQRVVLYPERGRGGLGVLARSAVDGLRVRYARAAAV